MGTFVKVLLSKNLIRTNLCTNKIMIMKRNNTMTLYTSSKVSFYFSFIVENKQNKIQPFEVNLFKQIIVIIVISKKYMTWIKNVKDNEKTAILEFKRFGLCGEFGEFNFRTFL